jgi:hypothetical protein
VDLAPVCSGGARSEGSGTSMVRVRDLEDAEPVIPVINLEPHPRGGRA